MAGIARVVEVSEPWLQDYVSKKYESVPREVKVRPKKRGRLTIQCDKAWSFVDNRGNKQWIWLAIDEETRELVGVYVGRRTRSGASMGLVAIGLSAVCSGLHGFLGSL